MVSLPARSSPLRCVQGSDTPRFSRVILVNMMHGLFREDEGHMMYTNQLTATRLQPLVASAPAPDAAAASAPGSQCGVEEDAADERSESESASARNAREEEEERERARVEREMEDERRRAKEEERRKDIQRLQEQEKQRQRNLLAAAGMSM